MRQFPKDLLQLDDSNKFFKVSSYSNYKKGINLFSYPLPLITDNAELSAATFQSYSQIFNQDIIKVILIDASIEQQRNIGNMISKIPFSYYLLLGEISPDHLQFYDLQYRITGILDFISKVQQHLSLINTLVKADTGYEVSDFKLHLTSENESFNPGIQRTLLTTTFIC